MRRWMKRWCVSCFSFFSREHCDEATLRWRVVFRFRTYSPSYWSTWSCSSRQMAILFTRCFRQFSNCIWRRMAIAEWSHWFVEGGNSNLVTYPLYGLQESNGTTRWNGYLIRFAHHGNADYSSLDERIVGTRSIWDSELPSGKEPDSSLSEDPRRGEAVGPGKGRSTSFAI